MEYLFAYLETLPIVFFTIGFIVVAHDNNPELSWQELLGFMGVVILYPALFCVISYEVFTKNQQAKAILKQEMWDRLARQAPD